MGQKNSYKKGILCILAAAFGFSLMTFFVRISGDVPTMQKAFFRNAFAALITIVLLLRSEEKFRVQKGSWRDIAWRCIFGTSGLICNFYAIDRLGIADANMLNKLSPFFAILLSIPILKEVPSAVDLLATVVAFTGALFIIRPGGDLSVVPALIGLYGGFGAGTAYVFVRRLGSRGERTPIIVLCFSVFSCLVTAPFLIFDFHPMTLRQWLCLILAGVAASLGQFGITSAVRHKIPTESRRVRRDFFIANFIAFILGLWNNRKCGSGTSSRGIYIVTNTFRRRRGRWMSEHRHVT